MNGLCMHHHLVTVLPITAFITLIALVLIIVIFFVSVIFIFHHCLFYVIGELDTSAAAAMGLSTGQNVPLSAAWASGHLPCHS